MYAASRPVGRSVGRSVGWYENMFVCVGKILISWSSFVISWTKLSEAPKFQRHVGPHAFKRPWAFPWTLIHSVRMP